MVPPAIHFTRPRDVEARQVRDNALIEHGQPHLKNTQPPTQMWFSAMSHATVRHCHIRYQPISTVQRMTTCNTMLELKGQVPVFLYAGRSRSPPPRDIDQANKETAGGSLLDAVAIRQSTRSLAHFYLCQLRPAIIMGLTTRGSKLDTWAREDIQHHHSLPR